MKPSRKASLVRVLVSFLVAAILARFLTFTSIPDLQVSTEQHLPAAELVDWSAADVEDGVHGNLTGRESGIAKRAMAPIATFQKYYDYSCRGAQLVVYMLNTAEDILAHSGISQVENLKGTQMRGEWTDGFAGDDAVDMTTVQADLHLPGLYGVTGYENKAYQGANRPVTLEYNEPWVKSHWMQDQEYKVENNGNKLPATNGYYHYLFSAKMSAVVIRNARSPRFMSAQQNDGVALPDDQLPKVKRWSDLFFIKYRPAGSSAIYKPPRWYLIEEAFGPADTLEVISYCLRKYGWTDANNLPTWEQRFTFPLGSTCYLAILATPNSAGLAWYFIEHKFRYLDTALGSVTVWGSKTYNEETNYERPTLLWWAARVKEDGSDYRQEPLNVVNRDNEAFDLDPANQGSMNWPFKMTPTYR